LKPEQWGSPLVQEKYQEEKACDKRHPYRIIIIIIIITIISYIYFYPNTILVLADFGHMVMYRSFALLL